MEIKTIKQHLKDNKEKILLFLIGYILFVTSKEQLTGFETLFSSFSTITFFLFYIASVLLMYAFIKATIPLYKSFKIKTKEGKINFKSIFWIISIGSSLGLFTNIIQAFIIVTFSKYIGM